MNDTSPNRVQVPVGWNPADDNMRKDPNYAPYCMRCKELRRMRRVDPLRAECRVCGGVHQITPNAENHRQGEV